MITWVSDRSGMASSGIVRTDQTAAAIAAAVSASTTNLLWADHSISFSMIPSRRGASGSLAMLVPFLAHPVQRRLQAAFGITEEVPVGHDPFTRLDPGRHGRVALGPDRHRHFPGLQQTLP